LSGFKRSFEKSTICCVELRDDHSDLPPVISVNFGWSGASGLAPSKLSATGIPVGRLLRRTKVAVARKLAVILHRIIATEAVVRASPDGYTLLLATASNAINATVLKLDFDFVRDIAPIAGIVRAPLVMEVHPSIPAKTVAEFVAYARANPGKVNMASAGTGSLTHVAGEMFKTMAGVDLFHVPYRGAQVFAALLTGEAHVYFGPLLSSIEYVRAGNFRALAVTTVARSPILPDVPTLGETLPGYEASAWFGIGGPRRTPEEVIEILNKEVNFSIADPKLQARLASLGGTALGGSPADFAKLISDEVKKWSRVILAANVRPI
jgi:tripartite-type tricarboxylate transporter receptor subunit TctC